MFNPFDELDADAGQESLEEARGEGAEGRGEGEGALGEEGGPLPGAGGPRRLLGPVRTCRQAVRQLGARVTDRETRCVAWAWWAKEGWGRRPLVPSRGEAAAAATTTEAAAAP